MNAPRKRANVGWAQDAQECGQPNAGRQGGWFSRVSNVVLDDETLSAYQKSIYAALCRFADRNGRCHPSLAAIAAKAGCARRSVVEGLRVLEERGYVVRESRRMGGCRMSNLYRVYDKETERDVESIEVNAGEDARESSGVITGVNAGGDGTFCAPERCASAPSGDGVLSGARPKAAATSPEATRSDAGCGPAESAEAAGKAGVSRGAAFSSPLSPPRYPRGGGVPLPRHRSSWECDAPEVVQELPQVVHHAPNLRHHAPNLVHPVPRPGQDVPLGGAPAASRTRLRKPDPETRRGDQREPPRPGGEEAFAAWVAGVVDRILGAGGTRK